MIAAVSDATTLIVLAKLGRAELLSALFSRVLIPEPVFKEICAKDDYDHAVWRSEPFELVPVSTSPLYGDLRAILDEGESAAIAAVAESAMPLIIDEKKGRSVAASLGVKVIGLAGILVALKRTGRYDGSELLAVLDGAEAIGYRLSVSLKRELTAALAGA